MYVEPRNLDELQAFVKACHQEDLPVRLIGSGSNILVKDEGVNGAVIHLSDDEFAKIHVDGETITCDSGVLLTQLITESVKAGLTGLETLAGIPGTVGGALHGNAGGKTGEIGQFTQSARVMTVKGEILTRTEDELTFSYRQSSLDELVILDATFALKKGDTDETTLRLRKNWIVKKSSQPLSFQSAGCIFKNPRGMSAGALIEEAGLKGTKIGKAEISDLHANFIVTEEGASSDDVLRLIDLAQSKVSEQLEVDLELEIVIW
jgi:UDP-N-acetylmuramate dehydrogenase